MKKQKQTKVYSYQETAEWFNAVMNDICVEHMTIPGYKGDSCSEGLMGEKPTVEEMVKECKWWLSCYFEEGHDRSFALCAQEGNIGLWNHETAVLRKFIKTFEQKK